MTQVRPVIVRRQNAATVGPVPDSGRDRRSASAVGRAARLELVFERRRGRTIVAHAYAEPPFRVGRPFEMGDAVYLIVVCSGPGIFAGDALEQSVQVGSGARVVLTSQAALQVHPSAALEPAVIRHQYRLAADAELHAHFDPVIPFADARLDQRFDLDLQGSSRLYWSDALMAGRVSRGERWLFSSLAHELRLRKDGALKYLERYRLAPAVRAPSHAWRADAANYLATTLVHHERATADVTDACQQAMAEHDGVRAGVDLVEPGLAVARLMATEGAPFDRARASYRALTARAIFGGPPLLMRK